MTFLRFFFADKTLFTLLGFLVLDTFLFRVGLAVLTIGLTDQADVGAHLRFPATLKTWDPFFCFPASDTFFFGILLANAAFGFNDQSHIAALLRFFATHNDGWHTAETTFPGSSITVHVFDNDRLLLTVWVGSAWIGGRNGNQSAPDNRLRELSAADARELETLLRP